MSAPLWRWSLIGAWFALSCAAFTVMDSTAIRSWLLLSIGGVIPPMMLLWLWNEDRPLPIGSLHSRQPRR